MTQWLVEEAVLLSERARDAETAREALAESGRGQRLNEMALRALGRL